MNKYYIYLYNIYKNKNIGCCYEYLFYREIDKEINIYINIIIFIIINNTKLIYDIDFTLFNYIKKYYYDKFNSNNNLLFIKLLYNKYIIKKYKINI